MVKLFAAFGTGACVLALAVWTTVPSTPKVAVEIIGFIALGLLSISGILLVSLQIAVIRPRIKALYAKLAQIRQAPSITLAIIKSPALKYEDMGSESHGKWLEKRLRDTFSNALEYLGFQRQQIIFAEGDTLDLIRGRHWDKLHEKQVGLILRIHIINWENPPATTCNATYDIQLINTRIRGNEVAVDYPGCTFYGDGKYSIDCFARMILIRLIGPSKLGSLTIHKANS